MGSHDFEIAIVGSGFGGSVCALRAAEAGRRVAVLERGPRLTPSYFDAMATGEKPLIHSRGAPGILEVHRAVGFGALTGNAVGGGSQIYTAATVRARPEAFTPDWPGLSRTRLDPFYDRVERMIRPEPIPIDLPRTRAMQSTAQQIGGMGERLPLSVSYPSHPESMLRPPPFSGIRADAVTWLRGGPVARKRPLTETYLASAEDAGAMILSNHEVDAILPIDGGYRLHVCDPAAVNPPHWISAQRVILAAGAINTVRLLFRCRDTVRTLPHVSPALGRRFFTNGDMGALIVGPPVAVSPDAGPATTAWIDLWKSDRLFLMDMGVWPTPFGMLRRGAGHAWCIAAMGYDDAPATLEFDRNGRAHMRRAPGAGERFDSRRRVRLRDLATALGGTLIAPPAWIESRMTMTVHPMGGACMAHSPDQGVTNARGEIFGHPGLYIADASLFPTPTGLAPSMTIAAVAEFVIENLLA